MNLLIIVWWLRWRRTVFFTAQRAYEYHKLWGRQSHDVRPLQLLRGTRLPSLRIFAHVKATTKTAAERGVLANKNL